MSERPTQEDLEADAEIAWRLRSAPLIAEIGALRTTLRNLSQVAATAVNIARPLGTEGLFPPGYLLPKYAIDALAQPLHLAAEVLRDPFGGRTTDNDGA